MGAKQGRRVRFDGDEWGRGLCVCVVCRFKKLARLELPQLTSAYSSLVYVNHSFTALEYLAVGAFPVYRTLLDFELTAAVKTLIVGKVVEDAQLIWRCATTTH